MPCHLRPRRLFLAMAALLAVTASGHAIIKALLPLEAILYNSQLVLMVKVDKIDAALPQVVLTVQEDLKGKAPFQRLAIQFKGDDDAKKGGHVPQLLKRLTPDLPLVLFVDQRDKGLTAFAFSNGTWFQLIGQQTGDASQVAWRLAHGEPYLRRSFKGTTAELRKLVIDRLAGKAKLPGVNKKEEPGFGPEAAPKAKDMTGRAGGPLFGVIPTLGVGAPLLVLAALFPAVFGGVLILFRQWVAFITVFSLNSTLLLVYWLVNTYWPNVLHGAWLGTEAGLWFLMTLVAFGGTVWAWRRQISQPALGELAVPAPPRTELTVLWSLSAVLVLVSVLTPLLSRMFVNRYDPRADLAWVSTLVLTLGVLIGAIYRTLRVYLAGPAALATEGVMVAAILLGQVGYTAYRWGGEDLGATGEPIVDGTSVAPVAGLNAPKFERIRWQFSPPNLTGFIVAAPLVHGSDLYAAAARPFGSQGTLYCVDRATGTQKWEFRGTDGDLRQMISGPAMADGKLYMGEGFHDDTNCRLFCVNPADGKQLWAFKTTGQTECSPCVAGGKVYFGAGNDGIYCIDAVTGKEDWRFPRQPHDGRLLRCGATPVVLGNRLYAGSGIDRNQKEDTGETAIFCLDADGKLLWKNPVPFPVWAAPVLSDGHAFFALGNGDVFSDAESDKGGMLMCVATLTGKEAWRYEVPNGVLDKPAVDADHVYFGCRDGNVYCVGRHDGKLRWKTPLDSPVVAAPTLARCPGYAQTAHVFAVATAGKVACLNPATGAVHWSVALTEKEAHFSAAPRVIVSRTDGGDRRAVYVAGGVGGLYTGRPVVYCLEDFVKVE